MNEKKIEEFEIGAIRPPSEGGSHSLLLRFTRNCPWNNCTFCYGAPYGRGKFELRTMEEIKRDIDRAKAIKDVIQDTSSDLGLGGEITPEVVDALFRQHPQARYSNSFASVLNWLNAGGKTVFLQDANSLIMKTPDLVEAIEYLKEAFPEIERITSYARAKTVSKKSFESMVAIRKAGLSRLHMGLETGDDALLKKIHKGVTAREHVDAGKKIMGAAIELSEYIMPGLGGKEMTDQHALNTALVLNRFSPHYIRSRTFAPIPGTPLADEYARGDFQFLRPHGLVREIGKFIENLDVKSKLCFDHATNPCYRSMSGLRYVFHQGYEGYPMPQEKEHLLSIVEEALKIDENRFPKVEEMAMMAR